MTLHLLCQYASAQEHPSQHSPVAQSVLARDTVTISPSYPRDYPFVMDHGRGVEVWDVDGHRYIDWTSGIAVCATGHWHPEGVAAIQAQAEKFLHVSSDFYHPLVVANGWVVVDDGHHPVRATVGLPRRWEGRSPRLFIRDDAPS